MRLLIIPILILFTSCSTLRHYRYVANDHVRDSAELTLLAKAATDAFPPRTVIIKGKDSTVYRDSLIVIPGETITDTFPCPDLEYHSHIKGNNTSVKVSISKGKGSVECKVDSIQKVLDSVIRDHRRVDTVKETDSACALLYKQTSQELTTLKAKEKNLGYILHLMRRWLFHQWWFWLDVILLALYLSRNLWLKLIPGGSFVGKLLTTVKNRFKK